MQFWVNICLEADLYLGDLCFHPLLVLLASALVALSREQQSQLLFTVYMSD